MNFSPQQEAALEAVQQWMDSDRQVFKLFGYAGTGKTTLARHLHADQYAAFTGKAAHVLREKGCAGASTIHSLIYNTREKSAERLRKLRLELDAMPPDADDRHLRHLIEEETRNLRQPSFTLNLDSLLRRTKLLVIDECSMVDRRMGEDLLSFGCKVLVLGDPAQLPPVGGGGFFTEQSPDIMLTEIHRQARENPILNLATRIRQGEPWKDHSLTAAKVEPEEAMTFDQIIVGRNATRTAINARCRDLLGMPPGFPVAGDKVVCLRNNHEIGILNGAIYDVESCDPGESEEGIFLGLAGLPKLSVHTAPFVGRPVDPWSARDHEMFDYGYALTCHKSQGSQWDSVLVFDESRCFRGKERRWLYTAVTRAAKRLKVVV